MVCRPCLLLKCWLGENLGPSIGGHGFSMCLFFAISQSSLSVSACVDVHTSQTFSLHVDCGMHPEGSHLNEYLVGRYVDLVTE